MAEGRTLYRSRSERIVAGVCGGIAEYFDLDPTVVRLIAVAVTVLGNAVAVVAYLVMWVVVPEEPPREDERAETAPAPQPGPVTTTASPRPVVQPAPPVTGPGPALTTSTAERPVRRTGVAWFGAILIAVGGALMVDLFVPSLDIWGFWPLTVAGLVVIALGVKMIFTSGGGK